MIDIKNPQEIKIMQEGGEILSRVLFHLLKSAQPGVSLRRLDQIAEAEILKNNAVPSFKMVKNYKWSICTCVNDVVVHGVPDGYLIKMGDVIGIDCGVYYKGFHTDASWTIRIKDQTRIKDEIDDFLQVGQTALINSINQVKEGNYIYDISNIMQKTIENAHFSVVKTLVGHGVGRKLHEAPEVPNFVTKPRTSTDRIIAGMTLAIEAIYNYGTADVCFKGADGWTIATKDGKISGLFEATVAATSHGCLILTKFSDIADSFK